MFLFFMTVCNLNEAVWKRVGSEDGDRRQGYGLGITPFSLHMKRLSPSQQLSPSELAIRTFSWLDPDPPVSIGFL